MEFFSQGIARFIPYEQLETSHYSSGAAAILC